MYVGRSRQARTSREKPRTKRDGLPGDEAELKRQPRPGGQGCPREHRRLDGVHPVRPDDTQCAGGPEIPPGPATRPGHPGSEIAARTIASGPSAPAKPGVGPSRGGALFGFAPSSCSASVSVAPTHVARRRLRPRQRSQSKSSGNDSTASCDVAEPQRPPDAVAEQVDGEQRDVVFRREDGHFDVFESDTLCPLQSLLEAR